ncbi:MAG: dipeptide/oligopeptide/nickel ABC transporter permease/ATP-binding protein [Promicromonosporaceae bacterium]|nr:dipeptide/oligopeptide/nickel ABC transporter permease/ATP-binding protein [Promicromonosporaceae bacterium]
MSQANDGVARRLLRNPLAVVALSVLAIIVLAAICAPLLTSHDPFYANLQSTLADPFTPGHILGADSAGRDVFARLLFGARMSLLGALVGLTTAVTLGTVTGLLAGYFGKWFDQLASGVGAVLMALPGMVVMLAARSVTGPSMWVSMLVFGTLVSAAVFRLVRQTVQSVRDELYVDAARVAGLTDARIIFRHVLRVVRGPLIVQAGFIAVLALSMQTGLEVLGLGDLTLVTWGAMLNDGVSRIFQQPILVVWPGLILAITTLSLTLFANALRDTLQGTPSRKARRPVKLEIAEDFGGEIEMAADELLRVEGLKIGYQGPDGVKEIVHGIDFQVRRGEVVGLIGESGSGKTQTAFAVLRLLSSGGGILAGRVLWKGVDLARLSEKELEKVRGAQIAYIPQEPMSNLDPSFTVGSQLVEPMRHHLGLSKAKGKLRAIELLDRVGIPRPERVFSSYPHELSGGMAQRVLIARAVSCNPDLIIADEPTTALDVTVQAEILDLLRDLQRDLGVGILMVTHNFGIVADLCGRVLVMQEGHIVERGETETIFDTHHHAYTRQLFGAILDPHEVREAYRVPASLRPAAERQLQEVGA